MNRRKFFGLVAASPIAAKSAANSAMKSIVEKEAMDLSGFGVGLNNAFYPEYGDPSKIASMFKGLPWWKEEELFHEARTYVRNIRPDIAGLRSVALSAKYNMEVKRIFESRKESTKQQYWPTGWQRARKLFTDKNGLM